MLGLIATYTMQRQVKRLYASTIYNHLCDHSLAIAWFSLGHDSTSLLPCGLAGCHHAFKTLKRSYKAATNKHRVGKNTMDRLTHTLHTLRAFRGQWGVG